MATVFVNVGVVRVQEYILRTSGADERQLQRRRGASRMIAAATKAERFRPLGLTPNDETYEVEGVVHLKLDIAPDIGITASPNIVAAQALQALREELPHAHLVASWAAAESYAEAAKPLKEAFTGGSNNRVVSIPPLREDPDQSSCRMCGIGVVDRDRSAPDKSECLDCQQRLEMGARHSGGSPEDLLIELFAERGHVLNRARDLTELAHASTLAGSKRNHLATVYADGNSMGALFDRVTPEDAPQLSRAIDDAIHHAVTTGINAILPGCSTSTFPAWVTTLAADDAVVTVPASVGWRFVTALVEAFNSAMAKDPTVTALKRADDQIPIPTLTAGIVFSQVKSPIETAIRAADGAMRIAKRRYPGRGAIGWGDLTVSSEDTSCRPSEWFTTNAQRIDAVAVLPGHQRAEWQRILAIGKGTQPDGVVRATLANQAQRLGLRAFTDHSLTLDDIDALLGIARWHLTSSGRGPE